MSCTMVPYQVRVGSSAIKPSLAEFRNLILPSVCEYDLLIARSTAPLFISANAAGRMAQLPRMHRKADDPVRKDDTPKGRNSLT